MGFKVLGLSDLNHFMGLGFQLIDYHQFHLQKVKGLVMNISTD
jgi:hypothetical protein